MSKNLPATRFDYSELDDETASKLQYFSNSAHSLIRKSHIRFIADFGEILSNARQLLSSHGDGTFCKWATAEFDLSKSTIYNYVNAWERCLSNGWTNFSNLTPTAIYLLCHSETPEPVRKKALKLSEKQQSVTKADVESLLERFSSKLKPTSTTTRRDDSATDGTLEPAPVSNADISFDDEETPEDEADPFDVYEDVEEDTEADFLKARSLAHQYRDKLARAICDCHDHKPNRAKRDELVKLVQSVEVWK